MPSTLRASAAMRCLAHHSGLPPTSSPARSPGLQLLSVHHQRRWAQVLHVPLPFPPSARFLATAQPDSSAAAVLAKYREKLRRKAALEGHASIDDLKAAYAERIEEQRKQGAIPGVSELLSSSSSSSSSSSTTTTTTTTTMPAPTHPSASTTTTRSTTTPSTSTATKPSTTTSASAASSSSSASTTKSNHPASTGNKPAVKPLGDILDLEKIASLPDKELTAIWRLRHASSPNSLCAVIPATTYAAMHSLARSSPQFVLPVPHPDRGAEMHFLQWTFDPASHTSTVLFTQLLEYKTRGEFAQPHTTVTHHLDLMADRGLVLMQGQVVEGRGVLPEHAKWLLLSLQRFYGGWGDGAEGKREGGQGLQGGMETVDSNMRRERAGERRRLLEWFTKGDPRFSVEKLIEEAERMG